MMVGINNKFSNTKTTKTMKKYLATALTLILGVFMVACSDDEETTGYKGKNTVTLAVESGATTLIEDEDEAVTVSVTLDRAYSQNVSLSVQVQGTEPERLVVTPQPVTIAAGSTKATFEVQSSKQGNLAGQLQYTLTCGDLQSDMTMGSTVTINLRPRTGMDDLTDTQLALIESWKNNYGIDVTPWMGQISLEGDVTEPGDGLTDPFVEQKSYKLNGKSVITLGEGCTEDKIVLKMVDNPLGMTNVLYDWLRKNTIEDEVNFTQGYGGPIVMDLINWNKNTQETFNVSLDGIEIDLTEAQTEDGVTTFDVKFVKEGTAYVLGLDGNPVNVVYDEEAGPEPATYSKESWIPFTYEYTAWSRLLQKVAENDDSALELFNTDGTADPEYYLLPSDVNYDMFESEENNFYVEPKGSINFQDGTMEFVFPADHVYAGGYARVNVKYSVK